MSPTTLAERERLLSINGLTVEYTGPAGTVTAVNGVDLDVSPGETLGLVGESGCGKSTLGRALLRLVDAAQGEIEFDGKDLLGARGDELRSIRRDLQIVFQDPRGALDPRMRIESIVEEPLAIHRIGSRAERRERAREMLAAVGIDPALGQRRPTELSGGQQQRVGIARALVSHPKLVICDEAVSALDVSVQAQVINLLQELKEQLGVAYLFIAHNLAVVRHLSDRVAVMYLGTIVEEGDAHEVFSHPRHPYTKGLMASVLRADEEAATRLGLANQYVTGDIPSLFDVPSGCRYRTRCPFAVVDCAEIPELRTVDADVNHRVACHRAEELGEVDVVLQAR